MSVRWVWGDDWYKRRGEAETGIAAAIVEDLDNRRQGIVQCVEGNVCVEYAIVVTVSLRLVMDPSV